MTPDERSLLQTFLQDLVQTRIPSKDMEADGLIAQALRASPDAPYVLVQHALMSDQALHAAQAQIAALQDQLRAVPAPYAAPAPQAGFLGGASPWAQAAAGPGQPQGFMGPGPMSSGGGLGSFMRSAGTTAAGVAGGALLFEGISSLFGGGHGGGFGGFGGGGGGEVINNYYGDDDRGGGDLGGGGGWDDSSGSGNN